MVSVKDGKVVSAAIEMPRGHLYDLTEDHAWFEGSDGRLATGFGFERHVPRPSSISTDAPYPCIRAYMSPDPHHPFDPDYVHDPIAKHLSAEDCEALASWLTDAGKWLRLEEERWQS